MKSAPQFSAEGRTNTKLKRQRDYKRSSSFQQAAESYKTNTTKEELCYEYIQAFTTQFHKFYPHRKKLLLTCENEFGIKKFVCTTVRPTQVSFSELYDLYECASYVAGHILFEPLDPPNELPKAIFSPTETLNSYTGDSFDIATLLCSFLIGDGYDAYVVCGYAPKAITLRDQSMTACPMIQHSADGASSGQRVAADNSQPETESVYITPDYLIKDSVFEACEKEKRRVAALDTFVLWQPEAPPAANSTTPEPRDRVHAWVLVCAGRRDVKEHIFLEASTGRAYSLANCPYYGIESMWNASNYWVNLYPEKKIDQMEFDLANTNHWEVLFMNSKVSDGSGSADADNDREEDADEHNREANHAEEGVARMFSCPPSWVNPLSLDRKRYLLQYPPNGRRTVQYFRAKADFFARGINGQSMSMRIIQYLDVAQTIVSEIHEWFENRKDKMYKRVRYYLNNARTVECYHPGNPSCIKQWTEYPGKKILVDFYVEGRIDRMLHREEIIGSSVTETFQGNTNHLIYRSVQFTTDKALAGQRIQTLPGGSLAHELYVLKMTQAFDPDPDKPPGTDIAKRSFYVKEGKAVVRYHFEKSQVTGKVRTFIHTRLPNSVLSDEAVAQEVGIEEDPDLLQEAITLERECYSSIKFNFQMMQKVVELRENAENLSSLAPVTSEFSVFDVALDKAQADSSSNSGAGGGPGMGGDGRTGATGVGGAAGGGNQDKEYRGTDYLLPYLRNIKDPHKITKDEALEIRQNCLDALKARLVERANIIQSRLNEENSKLGKEQEKFQRSQREGDLSTEDYEKYCTGAMFRIQILEQRLVAHEEAALKKFTELDAKLASDPRLRVLKNL